MTGQPPSGPLKYKVATPEEAPSPKRLHLPPPKKLRLSHWEALFRVVIVLVILVSIAVAYWSFFERLLPLQQQSRSMCHQSLENVRATGPGWSGAGHPSRARRSAPATARSTASFSPTRPRSRNGCARSMPRPRRWPSTQRRASARARRRIASRTTWRSSRLQFRSKCCRPRARPKGKSPYERVLAFGQQLAAHGKRADLAELTVAGGAGSISRAELVFNLWAGDLGAEAALTDRRHQRQPRTPNEAPAQSRGRRHPGPRRRGDGGVPGLGR